jgi:predicted porin
MSTRFFKLLGVSAIAAPTLALAQSSTSVSLYGQATAGVTTFNNATGGGSRTEVGNSVLAASLFGLRGTEDLGGGISALFRLESEINTDTGTAGTTVAGSQKFWNRGSYVGVNLQNSFVITAGRQYLPHADRVIQTLDVYNVAGTSLHTTPLGLFGVNRFVGNDSRTDDSVKVRYRGPLGLTAGLGAGLNDGAGRSVAFDIAQVRTDYAIAAYGARFQSPNLVAATGKRPEHQVLGLGGQMTYGAVRMYLHVGFGELDSTVANRPTQKNRIIAPGVAWQATPALSVKAAIYHDRATALNGVAGRDGTKVTLVTSGEYFLSKRTSLYAAAFSNRFEDGYKLDPINVAALARDPSKSSVTGLSLGMRHDF